MVFHDVEGIGAVLHNMSVVLIALNDFERAVSTYQRAREHCAREGMPLLVVQADYNIAYLHYLRGDYSRALDMLRAVRVACGEVGDAYHAALSTLDESEIYVELNLSEEAADMARKPRLNSIGSVMVRGSAGAGQPPSRSVSRVRPSGPWSCSGRRRRLSASVTPCGPRSSTLPGVVLCNEGRYVEARRLAVAAPSSFRGRSCGAAGIVRAAARADRSPTDELPARAHCQSALDRRVLRRAVLEYQALFLKGQIEDALGNLDGRG